jgi:hypothetical protein
MPNLKSSAELNQKAAGYMLAAANAAKRESQMRTPIQTKIKSKPDPKRKK